MNRLLLAGLLAAIVAGGCARRSQFIGSVLTDGADGGSDRPMGGAGGGTGGSGGGGASGTDGADGTPAACQAVDPPNIAVGEPGWNCGERCWQEPDGDRALFLATEDLGADRRPQILYPLPESLHPLNLANITLQWSRGVGAGQRHFRVRISPGQGTPYELFLGFSPPSGGITPVRERDVAYRVPDRVWRRIAQDNAGASVTITVAGYDSIDRVVAPSPPITILFSPAPVVGGLYFLSTELAPGIKRHVFGAGTAELKVPINSPANRFDCGGCHSPSRQGERLAFAATYSGNLTVSPTADPGRPLVAPAPPPAPFAANAISPALHPDGTYVIARRNMNDSLVVYDAASGTEMFVRTTFETGGRIDFPQWSRDGSRDRGHPFPRTAGPERQVSGVRRPAGNYVLSGSARTT